MPAELKAKAPTQDAPEPASMTGPGAMFLVVLAFAGFGVYKLLAPGKKK